MTIGCLICHAFPAASEELHEAFHFALHREPACDEDVGLEARSRSPRTGWQIVAPASRLRRGRRVEIGLLQAAADIDLSRLRARSPRARSSAIHRGRPVQDRAGPARPADCSRRSRSSRDRVRPVQVQLADIDGQRIDPVSLRRRPRARRRIGQPGVASARFEQLAGHPGQRRHLRLDRDARRMRLRRRCRGMHRRARRSVGRLVAVHDAGRSRASIASMTQARVGRLVEQQAGGHAEDVGRLRAPSPRRPPARSVQPVGMRKIDAAEPEDHRRAHAPPLRRPPPAAIPDSSFRNSRRRNRRGAASAINSGNGHERHQPDAAPGRRPP